MNGTIYQISVMENDEIKKKALKLLQKGRMKASSSLYGSLVMLVKKIDGTLRLCIECRALNKINI